jgi:hypothetical protein
MPSNQVPRTAAQTTRGLCWKREFGGILKLGRAAKRLREIGVSTALASAAVAALIFVNGGV